MMMMMMMMMMIMMITMMMILNNNNNNNNNWSDWDHFKSIRKYASNIPGNHDVREMQKTAILGTAHILRKVLT